jgi:RNA polymerase sigma factor
MYLSTETLEERVISSQKDPQKNDLLIKQFKPFIASVIQKRLGKFLTYGVDEELSIGLLAFNEAINSYNINKGRFLSFSRLVITNRIIDYYRKQSRQSPITSSFDDTEDEITTGLIDKKSVEQFTLQSELEDKKFEIIEYSNDLSRWGINFSELEKISPKQDNLRREYINCAKMIANDENILNELMRTKRLPIKNIAKNTPLHRKKIERGRIYIIALVIAIVKKYSFIDL